MNVLEFLHVVINSSIKENESINTSQINKFTDLPNMTFRYPQYNSHLANKELWTADQNMQQGKRERCALYGMIGYCLKEVHHCRLQDISKNYWVLLHIRLPDKFLIYELISYSLWDRRLSALSIKIWDMVLCNLVCSEDGSSTFI
jgi:hypothetical protein